MSVDVHPVTAERWDDVVEVFGRRGQDPSWCWCQCLLRAPAGTPSAPAGEPDNRSALQREVAGAPVLPGLLAHVGERPVG